MSKKGIFLSAFFIAYVLNFSEAFALKLKVTNNTDKSKHLFIRSNVPVQGNVISPYKVVIPPTPRNTVHEVDVDESQVGITTYYDVIAADNDGDPDWKLLGGTCKDLHKDIVQHILIDSAGMGLKTTCKTYGK